MTTKNKEAESNPENVREAVDVLRTKDRAILIPEGMDLEEVITHLRRRQQEEETVVAVSESVDAFPPDGAVALQKALAKIYGWTALVPTPGFWGGEPPTMQGVMVGVNETVKVPWGRIKMPGVEGYIETGVERVKGSSARFKITGMVKQKHYKEITELAKLTREIVKADSIYRGKALQVSFESEDTMQTMKFLDLTKVQPFIFARHVEVNLAASIFTPILHRERTRQAQVPFKRGVLLAGRYGTGKTLVAYATAQAAQKEGITFLLVKDVKDLLQALELAARYAPCVVFAEDLDRVSSADRDEETNKLLNQIDGVLTKTTEVMLILTTNHLEEIHPAMLRPGRMDDVIRIVEPDKEAVVRLIRLYGGEALLTTDEELRDKVSPLLEGRIPAVIAECVQRAKLYAIARNPEHEETLITAEDLALSAQSIRDQAELIDGQPEPTVPTMDQAFRQAVQVAVRGMLDEVDESPTVIQDIHERVHRY